MGSTKGSFSFLLLLLVVAVSTFMVVSVEADDSECNQLRLNALYEGGLSSDNQSHCFILNSDQFDGDGNSTFQILFDDHHSKAGKYLCGTVQYYSKGPNDTSILTNVSSMCMEAMEDRNNHAPPFCFNVDKKTTTSVLINITCIHYYFDGSKAAENNCGLIPEHISWGLRVFRGCEDIYAPARLTWLIVLTWIFVIVILVILLRYVIRRWRRSQEYIEIPATVCSTVPESSFVPAGTTAPTNPALRSFMGYTAPPQK